MKKLDGYISLSAGKVAEICERTIEYIDKTQKFDDQEFKDWAILYFQKKCRQHWWQFWRRIEFKDLEDFNKWWSIITFGQLTSQYRLPSVLWEEDAESFRKVSVGFRDSRVGLSNWYPSNFGWWSKDVCVKLFPLAKKLNKNKEMFISLEDFRAITKDRKI